MWGLLISIIFISASVSLHYCAYWGGGGFKKWVGAKRGGSGNGAIQTVQKNDSQQMLSHNKTPSEHKESIYYQDYLFSHFRSQLRCTLHCCGGDSESKKYFLTQLHSFWVTQIGILSALLKSCTWLCPEIRTQDKLTVWSLIIVPLRGWKSSNIWQHR